MNPKLRLIISLVCMAAVIVYTVASYLSGRSNFGFVIAAVLCIGLPMMNILRILINGEE